MRRFIALVCCLAGLAACEKGAPSPTLPPKTTPPAVTSPTVSPSPSLLPTGPDVKPGDQPPVLTVAAKANTPQGAVEFVKYYWEVVEWSNRTMDARYLRTLGTAGCEDCGRWSGVLERSAAKGEQWVGIRINISAEYATAHPEEPRAAAAVDVGMRQTPWKALDSRGQVIESYAEERRNYRFYLARNASGWVVTGVANLEVDVK